MPITAVKHDDDNFVAFNLSNLSNPCLKLSAKASIKRNIANAIGADVNDRRHQIQFTGLGLSRQPQAIGSAVLKTTVTGGAPICEPLLLLLKLALPTTRRLVRK